MKPLLLALLLLGPLPALGQVSLSYGPRAFVSLDPEAVGGGGTVLFHDLIPGYEPLQVAATAGVGRRIDDAEENRENVVDLVVEGRHLFSGVGGRLFAGAGLEYYTLGSYSDVDLSLLVGVYLDRIGLQGNVGISKAPTATFSASYYFGAPPR